MNTLTNKTICCIFLLLSLFFISSCDLYDSGIFKSISESTKSSDSDLSGESVQKILALIGNSLYIRHAGTVKMSDTSSYQWKTLDLDLADTDVVSNVAFGNNGNNFLIFTTTGNSSNILSCLVPDPADIKGYSILNKIAVSFSTDEKIILVKSTSAYNAGYSTNPESSVFVMTESDDTVSKSSTFKVYEILLDSSVTAACSKNFKFEFTESYETQSAKILPSEMFIVFNDNTDDYHFFITMRDPENTSSYLNRHFMFNTTLQDNDDDLNALLTTKLETTTDSGIYSPIVGSIFDGTNFIIACANGFLLKGPNIANSDLSTINTTALSYSSNSLDATPIPLGQINTNTFLIAGNGYFYEYTGAGAPTEATATYTDNLTTSRINSIFVPDASAATDTFTFYAATATKWVQKVITKENLSQQML